LDDVLLNAAVQAGATVERARVEDCTDSPEFATLTLRRPDGTLEVRHARAVVGADGIHSVVARKSGLSNARRMPARFALGGHYRGVRSTGEYIDMFVDGRTYVAINPLAGDAANVMLVVEQSELERHCDDVEGFAEARARALAGDVLAGAQLEHKRIAIGPLAHRAQRLAAKHIVLVGDAARFVDPFTGQGVYLAMRCAQIAAECILAGTPHRYAHRAAREIAGRERAARIVSRVIGSARIARAAAALFRLHPHAVSPLVRRVTGAA
jgi:flavin-dependent dehydrogenase